jgi:hypothetical protein
VQACGLVCERHLVGIDEALRVDVAAVRRAIMSMDSIVGGLVSSLGSKGLQVDLVEMMASVGYVHTPLVQFQGVVAVTAEGVLCGLQCEEELRSIVLCVCICVLVGRRVRVQWGKENGEGRGCCSIS